METRNQIRPAGVEKGRDRPAIVDMLHALHQAQDRINGVAGRLEELCKRLGGAPPSGPNTASQATPTVDNVDGHLRDAVTVANRLADELEDVVARLEARA